MQADQLLTFGPYRFDLHTGQLWRGTQAVKLTGKAVAVLHSLLERAGQVVTKDDLFASVWSGTVVSDAALTSCIQELRQALRDDAKKPRFIETVYRRGFRFMGKVVSSQYPVVSSQEQSGVRSPMSDVKNSHSAIRIPQSAITLVGRESELTQLNGWLAKALSGERQLVFVTGEPGIGKTTLLEVFVSGVRGSASEEESQNSKGKVQKSKIRVFPPVPSPQHPALRVWIGGGQCIEHYGAGEAYLPILEALGRLCRETGGERLIELLKQHAPTWLVQMPALLNTAELETLQRKTQGTTRERMLRELAEALEVVTREQPLVLVLEDLHWSDVSTLDLLSMLARRNEPARLLILGTYRPVEVLTRDHPLKGIKQGLQVHGQCEELALDFLSEAAVGEYLTVRFDTRSPHPGSFDKLRTGSLPQGEREPITAESVHTLARVIHHRTDGNPLFIVNVIDHLLSQEVLVQRDGQLMLKNEDLAATVPENLRQLIEQQIARVSPDERQILEAASVAGAEFSAAAVAAGAEQTTEAVETHCDSLIRREQFLRTRGTSEWPDGTIAARYGFVHALYQEVLYEQISATRRSRLHRQIGERAEQAYSKQAREIAAELSVHFERGRDYHRAIPYLQYAGENALRRSAHQEAINLLTQGLALLKALPDTPERDQQELRLLKRLGPALVSLKGYRAVEVGHTYVRTYELGKKDGRPQQILSVLSGLQVFYFMQGEVRKAREVAEEAWRLAQRVATPSALMAGHSFLVEPLLYQGEFIAAREHLDQAWALYNPQEHNLQIIQSWVDPGVMLLCDFAVVLWFLGYPAQAQQQLTEFLVLAKALAHPFSLASALGFASLFYAAREEWQFSAEQAKEEIRLSTEHGFTDRLAHGKFWWGRALVELGQVEEGLTQMQQGLAFFGTTGAALPRLDHLPWLAIAYARTGRREEGLAVLAEALAMVDKTGARVYEAELYRIKGELTLQQFKVQGAKFKVEESPESEVRSLKSPNPKSQIQNPRSPRRS